MDFGIAVDRLCSGAKYRRYGTYEELVATWEDETIQPPSEAALIAAYDEWLAEDSAATSEDLEAQTAAEAALLELNTVIDSLKSVNFAALTTPQKTEALRSGLLLALKAVKYFHRKMRKGN
jgi:hypothetical protein